MAGSSLRFFVRSDVSYILNPLFKPRPIFAISLSLWFLILLPLT